MARTANSAGREFATYAVESLRRIYAHDSEAFQRAKRRIGGFDADSIIRDVLPLITIEVDERGLPYFSVPAPQRKRNDEY